MKVNEIETDIKFHPGSIDFVRTYDNFIKRYKNAKRISRDKFGEPVVQRAVAAGKLLDKESVKGVRLCLENELRWLYWRDFLWIIPIKEIRPFEPRPGTPENLELVVDSLILTVAVHREVYDIYSGIGGYVNHKIILGFEQICYWVSRNVTLKSSANEFIATHNMNCLNQRSLILFDHR